MGILGNFLIHDCPKILGGYSLHVARLNATTTLQNGDYSGLVSERAKTILCPDSRLYCLRLTVTPLAPDVRFVDFDDAL